MAAASQPSRSRCTRTAQVSAASDDHADMTTPRRVLLELPSDDVSSGAVVLGAALSLFDHDAEIVLFLTGVTDPTEEHAAAVSALCEALLPADARIADLLLLGAAEAVAQEHMLHVTAGKGALSDAHAVILLSALADLTEKGSEAASDSTQPGGPHSDGYGSALRRTVRERIRNRDRTRPLDPGRVPVVVAVAQVQSTWGALDTLCRALMERGDVRLEVLALGSGAEHREQDAAEFLRELGYEPRDLAWFEGEITAQDSAIDLVVFDNPYDTLRPDVLRSTTLASRGIRTALSPYGNNNIAAGEQIAAMLYDSAMHRLAWRLFARSEPQREMFARYCAVGAEHVRVLGLPKLDRVVAPSTEATGGVFDLGDGRPVVLWNPHFSVGEGGWSTFERYLVPMVEYFAGHSEAVLVVRPHFRLAHDAAVVGGPLAAMMTFLREAVATHENVILDDAADYLESFRAATAFVSDLSSLITEFLPTGKPLLYLHREDGPGVNQDAEYLMAMEVATSWAGVESFLQDVLSGVDRGVERRRLALQRHFAFLDGRSGHRIADELVSSLLAERAQNNGTAPTMLHAQSAS